MVLSMRMPTMRRSSHEFRLKTIEIPFLLLLLVFGLVVVVADCYSFLVELLFHLRLVLQLVAVHSACRKFLPRDR